MDIQINGLVSFLAGLLSFLSPCVLGIAPAYVSYISGVESLEKERKKVFLHTILFVVGFSMVFIFMGVGASFLGTFLMKYKVWFNRIAGFIIIIFGLQILALKSSIAKLNSLLLPSGIKDVAKSIRYFFLAGFVGLGSIIPKMRNKTLATLVSTIAIF